MLILPVVGGHRVGFMIALPDRSAPYNQYATSTRSDGSTSTVITSDCITRFAPSLLPDTKSLRGFSIELPESSRNSPGLKSCMSRLKAYEEL